MIIILIGRNYNYNFDRAGNLIDYNFEKLLDYNLPEKLLDYNLLEKLLDYNLLENLLDCNLLEYLFDYNLFENLLDYNPVSYTHLTLPTILLV